MAAVLCKTYMHVFSGRLEVRLMGCQDLLESVPGRCRVTNMSSAPGSPSESKSLRMRTGLSTRSTNGKTTKTDELSCESLRGRRVKYNGFHHNLHLTLESNRRNLYFPTLSNESKIIQIKQTEWNLIDLFIKLSH